MRTAAKIFLVLLPVIIFAVVFGGTIAHAQSATPQMVVTWQAYGSYVPPAYGGKALPNQESRLTASLELLSNGKLVDLSGQTIYWYLDDTLIDSGVGHQYIVFSPLAQRRHFLRLRQNCQAIMALL